MRIIFDFYTKKKANFVEYKIAQFTKGCSFNALFSNVIDCMNKNNHC